MNTQNQKELADLTLRLIGQNKNEAMQFLIMLGHQVRMAECDRIVMSHCADLVEESNTDIGDRMAAFAYRMKQVQEAMDEVVALANAITGGKPE